jgi:hypothetical protein
MKWFTKLLFLATILCFAACGKKDSITPTPAPTPTPVTTATVTTSFTTSVTDVTAISGGNITSNGGATVIESGICYATTTNPTITNTTIVTVTPIGSFASNIASLAPNTLYYVRAYAKNSVGIAYGNEVTFTTLAPAATLATIVTNDIIINSNTSATFSGSVTSNGGAPITTTSLVISWNNEVTGTATQSVSGTTFTKTDCIPGTIYTVKFQATNSAGIANGINKTAITGGNHVGQQTGGGTCIWTDQTGTKGLTAAPTDLNNSATIAWWNQTGGVFNLVGANNNILGGGEFNTNTIVNANCPPNSGARLCYDAIINGYTDWYMPNKIETETLIANRNVPGLAGTLNGDPTWGRYWSSYEGSSGILAWSTPASGGASSTDGKPSGGAIRPIRKIGTW